MEKLDAALDERLKLMKDRDKNKKKILTLQILTHIITKCVKK